MVLKSKKYHCAKLSQLTISTLCFSLFLCFSELFLILELSFNMFIAHYLHPNIFGIIQVNYTSAILKGQDYVRL
jgi:hypothetical protein